MKLLEIRTGEKIIENLIIDLGKLRDHASEPFEGGLSNILTNVSGDIFSRFMTNVGLQKEHDDMKKKLSLSVIKDKLWEEYVDNKLIGLTRLEKLILKLLINNQGKMTERELIETLAKNEVSRRLANKNITFLEKKLLLFKITMEKKETTLVILVEFRSKYIELLS